MNQFKVCDKNKVKDINEIVNRLKEMDETAEIVIGCQNICGICRTKPFVIVNGMPVIANDEEELISKVKATISK
ncbi:MAG: DUF1450 domain-containing protein [Bacilli bacterium]|nr:DUF1450 domain-containing protein [Bacilli bacterium]